eukprot:3239506-Ditylum_brightwellii.AAC.1
MGSLFHDLEYERAYIDDLLILSSSTFEDYLDKPGKVLQHLQDKGIKPQAEKVSAILALKPPSNKKQLCQVLGIIQYYHDIWEKRTDLFAPLTDLVSECGTTKTTRAK